MKLSNGVEWGLHCCVSISQGDGPVSAARLAELHGVPASYLAKHLQALSRAGIVRSTPGPVGGYVFTRPPSEVSVLQVVQAVEGPAPAFRCTEIRRRGPLALPAQKCDKPCAIARAMSAADDAWRKALAEVSVADLGRRIDEDSSGTAMSDLRDWLAGTH
jgi:Rrf2 family protein